jgi:hypothetical protein
MARDISPEALQMLKDMVEGKLKPFCVEYGYKGSCRAGSAHLWAGDPEDAKVKARALVFNAARDRKLGPSADNLVFHRVTEQATPGWVLDVRKEMEK